MHVITNSFKCFSWTNSPNQRQRVPLSLCSYLLIVVLDAETFLFFVDAWKEGEIEGTAIPDEIYERHLVHTESVLKISSLISSVQGMGRLVLTDKRLVIKDLIID